MRLLSAVGRAHGRRLRKSWRTQIFTCEGAVSSRRYCPFPWQSLYSSLYRKWRSIRLNSLASSQGFCGPTVPDYLIALALRKL
jgi:hypothetical protein